MRAKDDQGREVEALQTIISVLTVLPAEAQRRLITAAAVFLDVEFATNKPEQASSVPSDQTPRYVFSGRVDQSPKDFLYEKRPETDVDRVACLAYYLTHFRNQPHFKTTEISKLNTEAAQPRFSNTAYAVNNATQRGFLTQAAKNTKQLTVIGEQYVAALPDRISAKAAANAASPKKRRTRAVKSPARSASKE